MSETPRLLMPEASEGRLDGHMTPRTRREHLEQTAAARSPEVSPDAITVDVQASHAAPAPADGPEPSVSHNAPATANHHPGETRSSTQSPGAPQREGEA